MTETRGAGQLTGTAVHDLVSALRARAGVEVGPEVWVRAFPGGPADGFDAGADADVAVALSRLQTFGELASAELSVRQAGTEYALALLGVRGQGWEASLEVIQGVAGTPAWYPAVLRGWPA